MRGRADRLFRDRVEAGQVLGELLAPTYAGRDDVLVLGLPRGGVPVAAEVARCLGAPLDVFVVRKLGVPGHEELAMGAIATGGVRVVDTRLRDRLHIDAAAVERVAQREAAELVRRERAYRGDSPAPNLAGRTVLLVDDGLATGSSMRAAALAARAAGPRAVIAAAPVGPPSVTGSLRDVCDDVVLASIPDSFFAVGMFYADFRPTTDDEVRAALAAAGS